jgi:predicted acylesterase/phospholipase RssA
MTATGQPPPAAEKYRAPVADHTALLKAAPIVIDGLADRDWDAYRAYIDRSCDLTMRGGTTSGVVYPLAVCELAKDYVFRSVGGASAGAIAATATAAAEFGRTAPEQPKRSPMAVSPGFVGLEQLVTWLTSSDSPDREDWRLAQLFQPSKATRRVFRVAAASMQGNGPHGTGKSKLRCLATALLAMLGPFSLVAIVLSSAVWLLLPAFAALLPPSRWDAGPAWLRWVAMAIAVLALAGLGSAVLHGRRTAGRAATLAAQAGRSAEGRERTPMIVFAGAAAVPLLAGLVVFIVRSAISGGAHFPHTEWWATAAAVVVAWLGLSLSLAGVFMLVLGLFGSRFLTKHARENNFGLVPGVTQPKRGPLTRLADRWSGLPRSTGVPGLSEWLADRIDDLAGVPDDGLEKGVDRHALTFGDLWRGSLEDRGEDLRQRAEDKRHRVVNLELMTTNLSQGRPYRVPFVDSRKGALTGETEWLFCPGCLAHVLPGRVVRQLTAAAPGTAQGTCMECGDGVHILPEPWDIPVVMATRMSLSLPGLVSAVPLHSRAPKDSGQTGMVTQWFSDGGITSNFPIHFFDSLLPRWPTFGLNLAQFPPAPGAKGVFLPEQDSTPSTEQWAPINSAVRFMGAILDTFLGWRDTMQSALPGFRGRIAIVRQEPWEGGSNLFMRRATIKGLAERGREAGAQLRQRFLGADGEVGRPQTQTDRYRWIRGRLAMRKYRELSHEIEDSARLYTTLAEHYQVPAELGAWFEEPGAGWPEPDPDGPEVARIVSALAHLAKEGEPLAERVSGTPPVNPDLRLTPRE